MPAVPYIDLDLEIERTATGYHAEITNSPSGQAGTDFTLPFSDLELENFLLRLGGRRRAARRVESPEMEAAKGFGSKLFSAVFNGDMRSCLTTSQYAAEEQGSGLRVRLRLTNAPDLADLPWEYLYNPSLNRFLSLSVKTPLVRYLDLPERIRPLAVAPPLRVLVMISSPNDFTRLDVDAEFNRLNQALQSVQQQGLLTLERMDDASLSSLTRRLQEGTYHVFHFVGHGSFDESTQDGMLVLEDAEHKGRLVSAQYLGTVLHDHSSLRLAVLNACEGARSSRTDPFSGTAQSLLQQGIPAVIAMQFEITDEAAIAFSQEFYGAIARGYPVDGALAEARKAIFAGGNELEWGTPVLYMRAPDGRIFDLQPASPETQRRLETTARVHEAQAVLAAGDWAAAQQKAEAILAREPGQPDAARIVAEAGAQRLRAATYGDALLQLQAKNWAAAVPLLETLAGYRDADALLTQARSEMAKAAAPAQPVPAQPAVPQPAAHPAAQPLPAGERPQPARGSSLKYLGLAGLLVVLVAAGFFVLQMLKSGQEIAKIDFTPTPPPPTAAPTAVAAVLATFTPLPTSQPSDTPTITPSPTVPSPTPVTPSPTSTLPLRRITLVAPITAVWVGPPLQVASAIDKKYAALGGSAGFLGQPLAAEKAAADGSGRFRDYQGGSIYWSSSTGAWQVGGIIRAKWYDLSQERGFLGYPQTDELTTPDGVGRYNHFQGGSIYWTPSTGAHEVHGYIRDKWSQLGWEKSFLGYPQTDELTTPDGIGRYNHFQGGSIYWTPNTGAHEVHGYIRDKWAEMGWEKSWLGYPIGDEEPSTGGWDRQSRFQHGIIRWSSTKGAVASSS